MAHLVPLIIILSRFLPIQKLSYSSLAIPVPMSSKNLTRLIVYAFGAVIVVLAVGTAFFAGQAASLTSQLQTKDTETSQLSSRISSLETQVSSLESQVNSLQAEKSDLTAIVELRKMLQVIPSQTFILSAGEERTIATFQASYAGFVTVFLESTTQSTANSYVEVSYSYGSTIVKSYSFRETGSSLIGVTSVLQAPVLPAAITISFANTNLSNGVSARILATYFY